MNFESLNPLRIGAFSFSGGAVQLLDLFAQSLIHKSSCFAQPFTKNIMKETPALKVVYRQVADLIPYARNARTHSDEQVTRIASSIKEFGFTNPILIDGDNGIIAGHGRLMAAKKLGMREVPTIELSGMTDAQKRAYILADNKLALDAGWDEELLRLEFEELRGGGNRPRADGIQS